MILSVTVDGEPIPKGSARAFVVKGRAVVTHDNPRTKQWEKAVAQAARVAMRAKNPTAMPCSVQLHFNLPRRKSDLRVNGILKAGAPTYHVKKPDLDKLVRCVLDALTGIAWVDDSQVVMVTASKGFGALGSVVIGVYDKEAK